MHKRVRKDEQFAVEADTPVSAAHAWLTLGLLTLANILLTLDRTILQLVTEPIKQEFQLSDGQLGILLGLAFSLPLGVAGIILGPVIDRVRRRNFLALILSIWSACTFFTGFAGNYVQLLLSRASLGASEAGASPAAMSLLGDLFPVTRRSSAIGIYKAGVPLGILAASALTGYVVAHFGWRAAFFVAGVPGFLVSIALVLRASEPVRGVQDGVASTDENATSYLAALTFVFRNRTILPFAIGMLLINFSGAALSGFATSFLQRSHGLNLQQIGVIWGVGSALGIISPIAVGWLADRVARNGMRATFIMIATLTGLIGAIASLIVTVPSTAMAVTLFLAWQVLVLGIMTPCMATMISLTPPRLRGTVLSITLVGNMCIGFGFGPSVVGAISDAIGGPNSLGQALVIVETTCTIVAVAAFLRALRSVEVRL